MNNEITYNEFNLNIVMENLFSPKSFHRMRSKLFKLKWPRDAKEINSIISRITNYVEKCGIKVSIPRYKYDDEDKTTWKYIIGKSKDGKTRWIENTTFKY